ncbi:preprotein translocase subunit SecE [Hydromonas duriensis]|uniref:Protein translocase subunit SecE n=1 Tax=Hydromonas duriensis TaxID=1527608 RepID=A0A4R6Y5X7_9BURK|nr:preprotein translocase subunit SecE [Hydromonas duriensis]TDR30931.1 protein translocase subunit secE/sec61 gamma [Hydromonas duriensis]
MSQSQQIKDATSAKWGIWLPTLILVAAFLAYFFVPRTASEYLKPAILGAGFVAAVAVFFVSPTGKSFIGFSSESYREARKVVWPTRKEVLQMTGVVFAFVGVMSLFMWGVDKVLEFVLYDLILRWK